MEDLEERFKRLEGIQVKLIDQQKKMQIEQKGIEKSFQALVDIMSKLIKGNGNTKLDKLKKVLEQDN